MLDADVARAMEAFGVPGLAITIIEPDVPVFAKGYGVRVQDAPQPVDAHTVFPIASNTKAFTTAAIAMLADEHKLTWDDLVIDHLPGFRMYDAVVTREMTIRDLVTHRSGLGLGEGDLLFVTGTDISSKEIVFALRHLKPKTSFRSTYAYDNVLYVAAGELIAAVAHKPWADVIQTRILTPLGMADSAPTLAALTTTNRAGLHVRDSSAVRGRGPLRRFVNPPDYSNIASAGGIYSSAADMGRWIEAQLREGRYGPDGRRLFSAAQSHEMWTPQTLMPLPKVAADLADTVPMFRAYALGWIVRDYRGHKIVLHRGAVFGSVSETVLLPEKGVGFCILTNAEETGAYRALQFELLDHYLGLAHRDWTAPFLAAREAALAVAERSLAHASAARPPDPRPSLPLAAYAGSYRDAWYGPMSVRAGPKGLEISFNRSPGMSGPLEPWVGNTFRTHWRNRSIEDAFVTFAVDASGHVTSATLEAVSPIADFSFDYQDLLFQRAAAPAGGA